MSKIAEPVVTACNAEFYKAYAFGRCTLLEMYASRGDGARTASPGIGRTDCKYDSEDLSWVDIRIGE